MNNNKIVFYTEDIIGPNMAGPAIRYWELANQLSSKYEVVLSSPHPIGLKSNKVKLIQFKTSHLEAIFKNSKTLVTQQINPLLLKLKNKYSFEIINDAYDPAVFETWEIVKNSPGKEADAILNKTKAIIDLTLATADKLICASEKQLDLWIGHLASLDKISKSTYYKDPSLRSVFSVVSFGIIKKPPVSKKLALREKFALSQNDFVLIWGGGVWDWFDPLTLIKAIGVLSKKNKKIKLVFMGVNRPGSEADTVNKSMLTRAIELSNKLGLTDKSVYFNFGWVEYNERQEYLLDSDVGVSTHFNHIETRFSFRTRLLDYLWAGLPIITTKGDSFSNDIEMLGLGEVVDYESPNEIAEAILKIMRKGKKSYFKNIVDYKNNFYWDKQAENLHQLIKSKNSLYELDSKTVRLYTERYRKADLALMKINNGRSKYLAKLLKSETMNLLEKVR